MRMTQNKNNSINSMLQHGRVVDKICCVVFPSSGFPYLTLCTKQCKWKVANAMPQFVIIALICNTCPSL